MCLLPHFPLGNGMLDDGGAYALCVGKGLGRCLDKIVAEVAHIFSFRVALRAAVNAETAV